MKISKRMARKIIRTAVQGYKAKEVSESLQGRIGWTYYRVQYLELRDKMIRQLFFAMAPDCPENRLQVA